MNDSPRANFVAQYIMSRITHVTGEPDIRRICNDADYAWDRIVNPRPLPKAELTLIKEAKA